MTSWLILSLLFLLREVHSYNVKEVRFDYQDTGVFTVTSPGFPAQYPKDVDYRWRFNTTFGTGLKVDVHALDIGPIRDHCYDKLQLWQYVHNAAGRLVGRKTELCASHVNELEKTSYTFDYEPGHGTYLEIHFESDSYIRAGGFKLTITPICDTEIDASLGPGVLTSPLYPRHYPSQLTCRHVIRASAGKTLKLDVVDVDMQGGEVGGSCRGDHVAMTSLMSDGTEKAESVVCASDHASQYVSDTGAAVVEFVSGEGEKSSRGFKLSYAEVTETTTDESTKLTSPPETTPTTTTTEATTTEQQTTATTTVNDTDVAIVPIGFGTNKQEAHGGNSSSSSTTVIVVVLICIVLVVCISAFVVIRRKRNGMKNNMLFDLPVTFSAVNNNSPDLPPIPTASQEEIRRENPYVEIPAEGEVEANIYHEVGGGSTEVDEISLIKQQNRSKVYVELPPLPEKNAPVTERLNNKCVRDDDDDESFVKCHPVAKPRNTNNAQVTQMKNDLMKGYQRYTAAPTCDDGDDSDDVFTPSTSARNSYKQQNNSNANSSTSPSSSVYCQPRALLGSESCDRQQDAIKSSILVPISPEAIDGSADAGPSTHFPLSSETSTYDQVRKKPQKRESDYCMMKRSHDNLLSIDDGGDKSTNNESVYVKMNNKGDTSSESD